MTPLLDHFYNSSNEINDEIVDVCEKMCSTAEQSLPLRKSSVEKKKWYKDQTLSRLASFKKAAWYRWSANGRPKEGPLYDAKINTRAEFRKRMRVCAANSERKRIQRFDTQFKLRSSNRFKLTSNKKHTSSLRVNQELVTDPKTILLAWEDHFRSISAANTDQSSTTMYSSEQEVDELMRDSHRNDNSLLDTPFLPEELDCVLKKLKSGKAAGHDGVQAEHLQYGGPILRGWILQICNAIIELECIPDCLKTGIITPVYKGGGKDPLDTNSYRGVTLTSVLAKVLESLIPVRLQCHLSESDILHLNQTAYRKGVSCGEAIFSTLEVLSVYSQHCEKVYMCFYDLQKAFDSIQYSVLLKRLYEAGIDGRAWRLIRSWYMSPKCMVRVNGSLSSVFNLERGVLQGSVLSPALFLLIMDPLLKSLQSKGLGPSVCGTYAGAFIHADDIIRTISSSRATLQEQIDTVCKFAVDNGLSLNPTKCEVVLVSPSKPEESAPIAILGGKALTPHLNAKCLGYWWSWDLSASKAVDEAIKKARRAFFAFGAMGAFQGQLNPVSTRSIYETCVVPVLLFGRENWILTDSMLHQLESFQGEIGRRMLKLSKYHSTLSTRLALKWPSITARIFIRKLSLLSKVCQEGNNIGNKIFSSFNQDSLRLTQECRAMEGKLSCHGFTDALLSVRSTLKEIKRHVLQIDWEACITDASHHSSTAVASRIASETSWMKLWDIALDYGPRGSSSLQALYRELTRPQLQPGVCHLCGTTLDTPFFHHYTLYHTPLSDPEHIINSLLSASSDIFVYAKHY